MNILWLASWYPSQIDLYNGDFVQRHAGAVSRHHTVDVIHVIKDQTGRLTRDYLVETKTGGALREHIVYYYSPLQRLPVLGRLFSELKYRRVFRRQVAGWLEANGRPDLVHVHVCMKAGIIARWMKRRFGLAYLVTEHSSAFLPEAEANLYQAPAYIRQNTLRILRDASAVTAVSAHLRDAIAAFAGVKNVSVIPNVVDTGIFKPAQKNPSSPFTFLHVSGLGHPKNIEAILGATAEVSRRFGNFYLCIVGPEDKELRQRVEDAGLAPRVRFYAEMPQPQLAKLMQEAGALILFSRYETFGCVVIEALACGTPVLASDIPALGELVKNGINGSVVPCDAAALAAEMMAYLEGKRPFDTGMIAALVRQQFDYDTVARQFSALYKEMIRGQRSL